MPPVHSSCSRCRGSGLVLNIPLCLVCLGIAAIWCIAAYFIMQEKIDEGFKFTNERRRPVAKYALIVGPPIFLIWLAFSSFLKRACPRCTS